MLYYSYRTGKKCANSCRSVLTIWSSLVVGSARLKPCTSMNMKIYQKLVRLIHHPLLEDLTKEIGCKLVFHHLPDRYIPAIMNCEMTKTWTRAGLEIVKGQNHFTIGKVVDGVSTRFDRNAIEYQSWLGGYTVKLSTDRFWKVEDYCKLAVADQNSWLRWYGDPKPFTTIEGWKYTEVGKLEVSGYTGTLYEGGFTTRSDVGGNTQTLRFRFATHSMAALYNLANPTLALAADNFRPRPTGYPYEPVGGRVYLCIFDIKPNVKVVLYGNGLNVTHQSSKTDTFEVLKEDFVRTMKSCEIIEV